jgi:hypothetical protein
MKTKSPQNARLAATLSSVSDTGSKWRGRLLWQALLVAVGVHVVIGVGAGLFIVLRHFTQPEANFVSRPATILPPQVIDPKMAAAEFDAAASKPKLDKKLASVRQAEFALPDLPMMPSDQAPQIDFAAADLFAAGDAIGAGVGVDRSSGIGVKKIGGLTIKAKKISVVTDNSGSMREAQETVGKEADKLVRSTRGRRVDINGCRVDEGFLQAVRKVAISNVDAIYWLCDLQDFQDPEVVEKLREFLLKEKIKFYICSWDRRPSAAMQAIIDQTGGAFELRGR